MRFLSPIVQHSGYAHIGLWRNGDCKQARLHRLVAEAFCVNDNPQCKTQVNHLNEDKLDNRAENLEWVTAKENTNYGTCIERRIYGRERAVECVDMEGNVHCKFRSQAEANSWCGVTLYPTLWKILVILYLRQFWLKRFVPSQNKYETGLTVFR